MSPTTPTPQNRAERLKLANRLYREFHTRCFWHSPPDLVITEELLPFVIKGLRTYGGHRGFPLAGALRMIDRQPVESDESSSRLADSL
ncbi:MAG: hypothetical protein JNM56_14600 [Planctomycetia bacterium]|nr:hypothetical protein [Planctomycetia bacterium]